MSKLTQVLDTIVNEAVEKLRPQLRREIIDQLMHADNDSVADNDAEDVPYATQPKRHVTATSRVAEKLREKGKGRTRAAIGTGPRLVMRALAGAQAGLRGADIINAAETDEERKLNKSSVYNTLTRFTESGIVKHDQDSGLYKLTATGHKRLQEMQDNAA